MGNVDKTIFGYATSFTTVPSGVQLDVPELNVSVTGPTRGRAVRLAWDQALVALDAIYAAGGTPPPTAMDGSFHEDVAQRVRKLNRQLVPHGYYALATDLSGNEVARLEAGAAKIVINSPLPTRSAFVLPDQPELRRVVLQLHALAARRAGYQRRIIRIQTGSLWSKDTPAKRRSREARPAAPRSSCQGHPPRRNPPGRRERIARAPGRIAAVARVVSAGGTRGTGNNVPPKPATTAPGWSGFV